MYCKNCGTQNKEAARFCKKCGTELKMRVIEEGGDATTILQPEVGGRNDLGEDPAWTPTVAQAPSMPPKPSTSQASFISPGAYGTSVITEADLPEKFKPLSAWAYFGYSLLFGVVPFGWIIAIVFAVGKTENINLRNFARSFFCFLVVIVVLMLIIFGIAGCSLGSMMYSL